VLEIGCGDGANLIPMAYGLPGGEFVGIDLAARPLASGRETIATLGLGNVRLLHLDLLELPADVGEFDFIVAHGVYSWVPADVRDALLAACSRHLRPNGVAFVSYNTYPGCHLRRMVREMMLYHVDRAPDPTTRIQQGRALIRFLAEAQRGGDEWQAFLASELQRVDRFAPEHLFHDDLAPINEPLYFHEFIAHAARHELGFVAEAHFGTMLDTEYPEATRGILAQLSGDVTVKEQYLDFLTCRRFRQTLLARADAVRARSPSPAGVERFLVSSSARPVHEPVELAANVLAEFRGERDASVRTDHPTWKAAMLALVDAWPLRLRFDDVVDRSLRRLAAAGVRSDASELAAFLLAGYGSGALSLHVHRPGVASAPSPRPRASAIARRQAARGSLVTNLVHAAVVVASERTRALIGLLDGTRTSEQLAADLERADPAGGPVAPSELAKCLRELAGLAVLEA
jgi:SAM-dependent methyltransferase